MSVFEPFSHDDCHLTSSIKAPCVSISISKINLGSKWWGTRKWETERTLKSLLFAHKINGGCDADQNSFDGMVLLTGNGDEFNDVEKGMNLLNSIYKQVWQGNYKYYGVFKPSFD